MKTFHVLCTLVMALALATASCTTGKSEKAAKQSKSARVSLFDGKTLSGWTLLNCEATVDNGEILIAKGNGLVQTEKKYRDFVLEFEWKPLRDKQMGQRHLLPLRLRSARPALARPVPGQSDTGRRGQHQRTAGGQSKGLIKPGDWNRFKLTVRGTKAAMEINGTPAWEADGLGGPAEGYIALQAEVPGGGQHRFRNIYLTELK